MRRVNEIKTNIDLYFIDFSYFWKKWSITITFPKWTKLIFGQYQTKTPNVWTPMHMIEQPLKLAHRQDFWNITQIPWNQYLVTFIPKLNEKFCMEIYFLKKDNKFPQRINYFQTIFCKAGNSDQWPLTQEMLSRLEGFYTSSNLTEFTSGR